MCWPRQLLQVGRHRRVRLIAALLALAPDALVLADARPPALLALAPHALVLADARAPALLALAPDALVLADARPKVTFWQSWLPKQGHVLAAMAARTRSCSGSHGCQNKVTF